MVFVAVQNTTDAYNPGNARGDDDVDVDGHVARGHSIVASAAFCYKFMRRRLRTRRWRGRDCQPMGANAVDGVERVI